MIKPGLIEAFMTAVRRPGTDAQELIGRVGAMIHDTIGTKLLTASVFDMDRMQSRRIYSENQDAYPLVGTKPIEDNRWTEIVLRQHKVFSSQRIEEIAEVFFDWMLIQSLGCESNANIPVVVHGKVIGTLNLLHEAGYYTLERLAPVEALMPYATIAFMTLDRRIFGETA